ncbi:hypothetical protein, partial [Pseudomonas aeruginosa]|uniref:hypothetical protein n=1 Tax=Pseudomonas aeruginosa TaxID=287 RepID=UPI0024B76CEF
QAERLGTAALREPVGEVEDDAGEEARLGARVWLCRIMVTWGLVSAAMMFADDAMTFYVLRFLLGVAEA